MTREEAIKLLEKEKEYMISHGGDLQADALGMAINALEQEPCEDCVSRQTVLAEINNWWGITMTAGEPTICDYIRELPSVTPTTCIAKVTFSKDDLQELVDEKVKELAQYMERRWIPCSERLPKPGEYIDDVAKYYLVQNEYGDMLVARYTHSEYWEQIYRMEPIDDEVVAWMPLPKQYKTEMESEE